MTLVALVALMALMALMASTARSPYVASDVADNAVDKLLPIAANERGYLEPYLPKGPKDPYPQHIVQLSWSFL